MMVVYIIIGLVVGAFLGVLAMQSSVKAKTQKEKEEAEKLIREAKSKSEEIARKADLDAKELLYKLRIDFDKQHSGKKEELMGLEKRLMGREETLERRVDFIENKERDLTKRETHVKKLSDDLEAKNTQLQQTLEEEKNKLIKISSLSAQEARDILLGRYAEELRGEKAKMLKDMEDTTREEAEQKAKDIISEAIQRCAVDHAAESTVSVVPIPNDEIKGRIIGREGRNIRSFEMATGVDLVIDDTPEAVTLSSFDPIRREVARLSLEKLVHDGRIHPGRIEEVVEKTRVEFEKKLMEEGKNAAFEVGIHNLHPELVKLLGRLKYRTSFGQNALQHSKEVAFLMGTIASELELDYRIARRAGFLHDIGKSIDHQVEGTHAQIGADLLKNYGEN